jgi:single-stranded-DNA-specific exonuclease
MAKWIKRNSFYGFSKDNTIVEKLAKVRGVTNLDEWFNPPEKFLHNPYLLENIDLVAQRILKAIHTNEIVTILADVDADGVFACAVMYNYLREFIEEDRINYIHAQRSRGHGVETVIPEYARECDGLVKFVPEDTNLLIIVDSSSNSIKGCKYVKEEMGIDVLVIDHHHLEADNPYATIVNCQIGKYPNKYLSGSAMAWKVCKVLDDYMDIDFADEFIDLATIGLIGDMMSVKEPENRHIIYHGLANIKNYGLKQLLALSKVDMTEDISTTTISFKVSPAINACTRFDKMELALKLLTIDNEDEVKTIAKEMLKLNEERKAQEIRLLEYALNIVNNDHNVAVVIDETIDSGFRGLLAMQLVSELNKPALVLTPIYNEDNVLYKYGGSARAIGSLPFKSMCEDTRLFSLTQGHEQAFGVEISIDNLEKALIKFDEMIDDEDLQGEIYYDLDLDESDITDMDIKEIEKFGRIAGQGFPVPTFRVKGLIVESVSVIGGNLDTIKIVCDNGMNCMKFKTKPSFADDLLNALEDSFVVDIEVVGQLNINKFMRWKPKRQLVVTNQVLIDDFKIV